MVNIIHDYGAISIEKVKTTRVNENIFYYCLKSECFILCTFEILCCQVG